MTSNACDRHRVGPAKWSPELGDARATGMIRPDISASDFPMASAWKEPSAGSRGRTSALHAARVHRWFAPRDTLDTVAADTLTGYIATGVRVLRR